MMNRRSLLSLFGLSAVAAVPVAAGAAPTLLRGTAVRGVSPAVQRCAAASVVKRARADDAIARFVQAALPDGTHLSRVVEANAEEGWRVENVYDDSGKAVVEHFVDANGCTGTRIQRRRIEGPVVIAWGDTSPEEIRAATGVEVE